MTDFDMSSCIEVNGWKVLYEKIGSGSHPILLIPDSIGTARTDFDQLLEGDDELDYDKFTAIAVEPPGFGRFQPPQRPYGVNFYKNDCECYHQLMKQLGYDKYSIIGYSEGARVAFLLAAKYPQSIDSLVLSAFSTHTSSKGLKALMSTKSVEKWNKKKINSYLNSYESVEDIQKQWNRYLKFVEFYNQYYPEDIFKDNHKSILCRTLFTHGDMDEVTEVEQAVQCRMDILRQSVYLSKYEPEERVNLIKLHRFPFGERDSHQRYAPQYLKLVQDHILDIYK